MNDSKDARRQSVAATAPDPPEVAVTASSEKASRAVEHLSTAECWELVEARSFGRLAVEGLDGIPDVFPVNYTVHDGSLYIRSAPGSKLMALAVRPFAAFEIDGEDGAVHWSVVLRGAARRLAIDKEIRDSGVLALVSASPTGKHDFVCVTPASISGRRFTEADHATSAPRHPQILHQPMGVHEPTRPNDDTVDWPDAGRQGSQRPTPIPHLPPRNAVAETSSRLG